jgi:hypothetical protein
MNAGTTSIAMATQDPADVLVPGSPCGHCGQPSSFRCAHPCKQSYCGKECQKAHRRIHKRECPYRKERAIEPEIQTPMADQDPADVLVPGSPCGHCGQPSYFRCAHPCKQSYCGKDCQKADRRIHKNECPYRKERVIKPEI